MYFLQKLFKNLETLQRELEESGESLIDPLHGHGRFGIDDLLCNFKNNND